MKMQTTLQGVLFINKEQTDFKGEIKSYANFLDTKVNKIVRVKIPNEVNYKFVEKYDLNIEISDYAMNGKAGVTVKLLK